MDALALERLRDKLSRTYEITATRRLMASPAGAARGTRLARLALSTQEQFLSHYFARPPGWRLALRRLAGRRTLPDFALIGAPKSGTSDLAISTMLHPNVLPPFAKEFWARAPQAWEIYYATPREKARHASRHGLALSPFFLPCLHQMEVAHSLQRLRPDIKVVLTLRNPVDRLFSQWKWELLLAGRNFAGLPFLSDFDAFVDKALAMYPDHPMYSACGYPALQSSIYTKAVRHWVACFGQANVRVWDVQAYFDDRNQFLRQIQDFVGLPPFDVPPSPRKVNENPLDTPAPAPATIARLREFFRPHNDALWTLLGKEFAW